MQGSKNNQKYAMHIISFVQCCICNILVLKDEKYEDFCTTAINVYLKIC